VKDLKKAAPLLVVLAFIGLAITFGDTVINALFKPSRREQCRKRLIDEVEGRAYPGYRFEVCGAVFVRVQ
jgi:hypothetical protein